MPPAVHLSFRYDGATRRLKVAALEAAGCDPAVFLYRRPHPAYGSAYVRVCRPEDLGRPAGAPDADGYHRATEVELVIGPGEAAAAIGELRAAVHRLVRTLGRPADAPAEAWKEWVKGDA